MGFIKPPRMHPCQRHIVIDTRTHTQAHAHTHAHLQQQHQSTTPIYNVDEQYSQSSVSASSVPCPLLLRSKSEIEKEKLDSSDRNSNISTETDTDTTSTLWTLATWAKRTIQRAVTAPTESITTIDSTTCQREHNLVESSDSDDSDNEIIGVLDPSIPYLNIINMSSPPSQQRSLPNTSSPQSPSEESNNNHIPFDPSVLRFKVLKVTRGGLFVPRTLTLHTIKGEISINNLEQVQDGMTDTEYHNSAIPVSKLTMIEKCHCDREKNRAILVIDKSDQNALDLIWVDQTTRDICVELLASLNRDVIVKIGCGGLNTGHWISDHECSACMKCGLEFGITLRRHHCRSCGGLFCNSCSTHQAALPDMGYTKPVRVCDPCFDAIRAMRVLNLGCPPVRDNSIATNDKTLARNLSVSSVTFGHHSLPATALRNSRNRQIHANPNSISSGLKPIPIITSALSIPPNPPLVPTTADQDLTYNSFKIGTSLPRSYEINRGQSTSPMPTSPHSIVNSPSSPSNGISATRDGKRDMYGFLVGDNETARGSNAPPAHLLHLAKQRKRWNQHLVLHPTLEKTPKLRKLVRKGIPPEIRGQLWQILSGSRERQKHAAAGYYAKLLAQAGNNKSTARTEIEKDLRRTFPDNALYESEEGLAMLQRVLLAYSVHNPSVGYCQSMNFICALCLLFMDEEEAFWLLVVIVEEITYLEATPPDSSLYYYQSDLAGVHVDQLVFKDLLIEKLPRIAAHLDRIGCPIGPITVNWYLCLFVNTLPLETVLHVWDIMFSEGVKMLFRTALALFKVNEKVIFATKDVEEILLQSKYFHQNASDPYQFVRTCFDHLWIGAFPMSRINQLRHHHRGKILRELKERARQMAVNNHIIHPPGMSTPRKVSTPADERQMLQNVIQAARLEESGESFSEAVTSASADYAYSYVPTSGPTHLLPSPHSLSNTSHSPSDSENDAVRTSLHRDDKGDLSLSASVIEEDVPVPFVNQNYEQRLKLLNAMGELSTLPLVENFYALEENRGPPTAVLSSHASLDLHLPMSFTSRASSNSSSCIQNNSISTSDSASTEAFITLSQPSALQSIVQSNPNTSSFRSAHFPSLSLPTYSNASQFLILRDESASTPQFNHSSNSSRQSSDMDDFVKVERLPISSSSERLSSSESSASIPILLSRSSSAAPASTLPYLGNSHSLSRGKTAPTSAIPSSSVSLFDGWRGLVSRLQETPEPAQSFSLPENPYTSPRSEIIHRLQQDVDQAEKKKWGKMVASQTAHHVVLTHSNLGSPTINEVPESITSPST